MTTFDQREHIDSPPPTDAERDSLLDLADGNEHPRVRLPFSVAVEW